MGKGIFQTSISLGILAALVFIAWQMAGADAGSEVSIIREIRQVAKLQTVEVDTVAQFTERKTDWAGASVTAIVSATGTVTASLDLEQMEILVDDTEHSVTLKLPAVEVAEPTHTDFDMQIARHGVFPPWFTDEEKTAFTNTAFEMMRDEAEEAGIRALAKTKAEQFLTDFVGQLGYDVRFI